MCKAILFSYDHLIACNSHAIPNITPCISLLNFDGPVSMLPYFSDSCSLDAVFLNHNRTLVSVLQYIPESVSFFCTVPLNQPFFLYCISEPVSCLCAVKFLVCVFYLWSNLLSVYCTSDLGNLLSL